MKTAVVYRTWDLRKAIPPLSPHPIRSRPCDTILPLLQCAAGSDCSPTSHSIPVQSALSGLILLISSLGGEPYRGASTVSYRSDRGFHTGFDRQPVEIRSDLFHRHMGGRGDQARVND